MPTVKNNKLYIALFCIMTMFFWGGQYTYVPTLTPYAKSVGASIQMLGLIGGSYGLMQFIFRIPIGIISDIKQKRKPSIFLGLLFVALSGVCFEYINSPFGILLGRAVSGIAASFWAVFAVMFASYFTDQVRGIGILSVFHSSGMVIATLLGGIISQKFGANVPFAVTIVLGCAGAIIALMLKEEKVESKGVQVNELVEVGKDRSVLLFSFLGILLQFISFGTAYVFTPLVAKNLGATDSQLGFLTFLFTLPGVFAALLISSKLFRKIGFRLALGVSYLLLAITCIPIATAKSLGILYILQFIAGFGRGICFTGLLSMVVSSVSKEKKATATSFYQAIYALGMFTGPVFTGLFGDTATLITPYLVMSILSLLASATTFVLVHPSVKSEQRISAIK